MYSKVTVLALVFLFLFWGWSCMAAQENEKTIIRSDVNSEAIASVSIQDFSWLEGTWRGEIDGDTIEETWMPAQGDNMVCVFRWNKENGVRLYELITLGIQDGTFIMRLKHFHENLHAWEDKTATFDFKLIDAEEDTWFFSGMTIQKHNATSFTIYVLFQTDEGRYISSFHYKKVREQQVS